MLWTEKPHTFNPRNRAFKILLGIKWLQAPCQCVKRENKKIKVVRRQNALPGEAGRCAAAGFPRAGPGRVPGSGLPLPGYFPCGGGLRHGGTPLGPDVTAISGHKDEKPPVARVRGRAAGGFSAVGGLFGFIFL